MIVDKKAVNEEYNNVINEIFQWYYKKIKTLSIVSPPYNDISIFIDIILEVLQDKKNKILYIWNGEKSNKSLLALLREKNNDFTHNFISSGKCDENLVFTNSKYIEEINDSYDLVIFDDISEFSKVTKQEIAIKYLWLTHISKKVILYTMEKTLNIGECLDIPYMHIQKPFCEPRVIQTKVNLEEDIPFMLYDYLKWFIDNKEITVLIVPDCKKMQCVYDYYLNKLKLKNCKIYLAHKENKKRIINEVLNLKNKSIIIITDSIDLKILQHRRANIVVLFADNRKFTYKKLIYLCGVENKLDEKAPEILFVLNEITDEINAVRNIARGFNKRIWEKKYLKE